MRKLKENKYSNRILENYVDSNNNCVTSYGSFLDKNKDFIIDKNNVVNTPPANNCEVDIKNNIYTISDKNGEVIFSCNGEDVYLSDYELVPGEINNSWSIRPDGKPTTGLFGDRYNKNGVLIIPKPLSKNEIKEGIIENSEYYIVTANSNKGRYGLSYTNNTYLYNIVEKFKTDTGFNAIVSGEGDFNVFGDSDPSFYSYYKNDTNETFNNGSDLIFDDTNDTLGIYNSGSININNINDSQYYNLNLELYISNLTNNNISTYDLTIKDGGVIQYTTQKKSIVTNGLDIKLNDIIDIKPLVISANTNIQVNLYDSDNNLVTTNGNVNIITSLSRKTGEEYNICSENSTDPKRFYCRGKKFNTIEALHYSKFVVNYNEINGRYEGYFEEINTPTIKKNDNEYHSISNNIIYTKKRNGKDYWLISFGTGIDQGVIFVNEITENGINEKPSFMINTNLFFDKQTPQDYFLNNILLKDDLAINSSGSKLVFSNNNSGRSTLYSLEFDNEYGALYNLEIIDESEDKVILHEKEALYDGNSISIDSNFRLSSLNTVYDTLEFLDSGLFRLSQIKFGQGLFRMRVRIDNIDISLVDKIKKMYFELYNTNNDVIKYISDVESNNKKIINVEVKEENGNYYLEGDFIINPDILNLINVCDIKLGFLDEFNGEIILNNVDINVKSNLITTLTINKVYTGVDFYNDNKEIMYKYHYLGAYSQNLSDNEFIKPYLNHSINALGSEHGTYYGIYDDILSSGDLDTTGFIRLDNYIRCDINSDDYNFKMFINRYKIKDKTTKPLLKGNEVIFDLNMTLVYMFSLLINLPDLKSYSIRNLSNISKTINNKMITSISVDNHVYQVAGGTNSTPVLIDKNVYYSALSYYEVNKYVNITSVNNNFFAIENSDFSIGSGNAKYYNDYIIVYNDDIADTEFETNGRRDDDGLDGSYDIIFSAVLTINDLDIDDSPKMNLSKYQSLFTYQKDPNFLLASKRNYNNIIDFETCLNCDNNENINEDVNSFLIDVNGRQNSRTYPIAKFYYDLYVNLKSQYYERNVESLYSNNVHTFPYTPGTPPPESKHLYNRLGKQEYKYYNYYNLLESIKSIGTRWFDFIEQVIPSTSIMRSTNTIRNTIFDNQKFKYRNSNYIINNQIENYDECFRGYTKNNVDVFEGTDSCSNCPKEKYITTGYTQHKINNKNIRFGTITSTIANS